MVVPDADFVRVSANETAPPKRQREGSTCTLAQEKTAAEDGSAGDRARPAPEQFL